MDAKPADRVQNGGVAAKPADHVRNAGVSAKPADRVQNAGVGAKPADLKTITFDRKWQSTLAKKLIPLFSSSPHPFCACSLIPGRFVLVNGERP